MQSLRHFINVDDDEINNMLCEMTIKNYCENACVKGFLNPLDALEFIKETYTSESAPLTLLFLDINMPAFSGWDFLDEFDHFPALTKDLVKICRLSSSVDIRDKQLAVNNKNVIDYIEKPLTMDAIKTVLQKFPVGIDF